MNIPSLTRYCSQGLVAFIFLFFARVGWATDISCLTCHEHDKIKRQFESSAHAQAGLTCIDCHGGDPKATDETAHASANFKSPSKKQEIAEMCAHCHADVRRMNPYGIPTDQLERYKTSKHGEQLFEHGDQHVAVCTDCHGVHDIAKVTSPQSHVYPTHIPDTCGRCHSDAKLMAEYKLPTDQEALYKTSYHAHMLFEKGDLSAPTCVTCHGSHGAVPPGVRQVAEVCGKCHGRQRELFEQSPHAPMVEAGLFSGCIGCHGNHAIQKASVNLYAQACIRCHKDDKKELGVRDTLAGIISGANTAYDKAANRVEKATVRGLATDDEQLLLQAAKTEVTQLAALQHTLAPDLLRPVAKQAQEEVDETLKGVSWLEQVEHWKIRALIPIWVFLGLMALLFWAKRRQLEEKEP